MLSRAIMATTVVSAIMLTVILFTTTPSSAGPVGILGFFIFMYLAALGVLTFLFRSVSLVAVKNPLIKSTKFRRQELPLRKSYYYASIVATAPVMLVAMQSVGQVGVYQILLVLFFVVVGLIYVTNRTA